MKSLLCITAAILLSLPASAGIFCETDNGSANGTWQRALAWDGTTRLTCNGGVRPVYYRITADAAWEARDRLARRDDLQAVFDDAWRGDWIRFTAGQTFRFGHPDVSVRINSRPGTGYLTVTTTDYGKLPAWGTRITPAYKPVMATLETAYRYTMFGLSGNGPSPATHVVFRGLYFQPTTEAATYTYKLTDDADQTYPFIRVGGGGGYNATTGIVNGDSDYPNTTVRTPTMGGNAAGQNVIEVADATRLTPGTVILVGTATSSVWYTVDTVITDTAGQHRITTTAPLLASVAANTRLYVPVSKPEYQPDQIVIQHCVFVNPGFRVEQARMLTLNSRYTIVRDNFFSGTFSAGQTNGATIRDTQVITGVEAVGPHYIENNYIDGGSENLMYGGSKFSSLGSDPNDPTAMVSSDIRYNYFSHIPERDYFGPWLLTQDEGVPGATRTYSGVSVPGLPPFSPRLVFSGRFVHRTVNPATGLPWANYITPNTELWTHRAMNTGVVGTTEPEWNTTLEGDTYDFDPARAGYGQTWCNAQWNPGDGVCWRTKLKGTRPFVKNNFELKHGKNVTVQHNVFEWFGSMKPYNVNQYMMVNIKLEGGLNTAACKAGQPFPQCWRGETKNIYFLNNVLRGYSGGIALYGNTTAVGPAPDGVNGNGNYIVRGNLFIQTERPWDQQWSIYRPIFVGINSSDDGTRVGIPDIIIEKNTIYSPFVLPRGTLAIGPFATTHAAGIRRIEGNIWSRGSTGSMAYGSGFASDTPTDGGVTITDYFPRTVANGGGGEWGKNIIVGAATTGFPQSTVWTGCASSAACITNTTDTPGWTNVFVNPQAGDFRLLDSNWGKRGLPDGSDIGADPNEVAAIRNLIVTPTDRSVHLQWTVTPPIAHIPCVVELHTAPDFESTTWQGRPAGYAGELSDIPSYFGAESDTAYWNPRSPTERTITLGRAVPLTPASTYYYRLHCGGDVRRGSFTTSDRVEGTTDQTISRVIEQETAQSMRIEYGLAYNRDTDSIEDSRTASSLCSAGQTCSVSFTVPRGSIVYYRWTENDQTGASVSSGQVASVVAQ